MEKPVMNLKVLLMLLLRTWATLHTFALSWNEVSPLSPKVLAPLRPPQRETKKGTTFRFNLGCSGRQIPPIHSPGPPNQVHRSRNTLYLQFKRWKKMCTSSDYELKHSGLSDSSVQGNERMNFPSWLSRALNSSLQELKHLLLPVILPSWWVTSPERLTQTLSFLLASW